MAKTTPAVEKQNPPIWWGNAAFFVAIHLLALYATLCVSPWRLTPRPTLVMTFFCYQITMIGITMGYHRLWSHRAFTARKPLRVLLALSGAMGFQGSIRWWVSRHRLHHRYTDDPVHDPYAATRGLVYSHVGWIFTKPDYPRWNLVDKSDLDRDVVVCLQHKHYFPTAVFMSFVLPVMLGSLWNDPIGGFVWGGLFVRIPIWHCTFFVNSLAHWQGNQQFSDEMSARGDLFLAALTAGEGNHNFHAFPYDYRNGPSTTTWDPTRWLIYTLHRFTSLVPTVRRSPDSDILKARVYMLRAEASSLKLENRDPTGSATRKLEERAVMLEKGIPDVRINESEPEGEERVWGRKELEEYVRGTGDENRKRQVLLIEGHAIDMTSFMKEHPGGTSILLEHLVFGNPSGKTPEETGPLRDATQAFLGKFTSHTRAAREKMRELRVATVRVGADDVVELL